MSWSDLDMRHLWAGEREKEKRAKRKRVKGARAIWRGDIGGFGGGMGGVMWFSTHAEMLTCIHAGPTSSQFLNLHGSKRMYIFQRGGVIQGSSTSAIIRQVNTILSSAMNEAQLLRKTCHDFLLTKLRSCLD